MTNPQIPQRPHDTARARRAAITVLGVSAALGIAVWAGPVGPAQAVTGLAVESSHSRTFHSSSVRTDPTVHVLALGSTDPSGTSGVTSDPFDPDPVPQSPDAPDAEAPRTTSPASPAPSAPSEDPAGTGDAFVDASYSDGVLRVTGSGFAPGATVSVTVRDAAGTRVARATAQASEDGTWNASPALSREADDEAGADDADTSSLTVRATAESADGTGSDTASTTVTLGGTATGDDGGTGTDRADADGDGVGAGPSRTGSTDDAPGDNGDSASSDTEGPGVGTLAAASGGPANDDGSTNGADTSGNDNAGADDSTGDTRNTDGADAAGAAGGVTDAGGAGGASGADGGGSAGGSGDSAAGDVPVDDGQRVPGPSLRTGDEAIAGGVTSVRLPTTGEDFASIGAAFVLLAVGAVTVLLTRRR